MNFLNLLFKENLTINLFLEFIFIGISLIFFERIFKIQFSKKNKFIYIMINVICFFITCLLAGYMGAYIFMSITSIVLFIYWLKITKLQTLSFYSLQSIFLLNIYFFNLHKFWPKWNYFKHLTKKKKKKPGSSGAHL